MIRIRHLIKAFTWRFIGTLDTIVLSWIISGNIEIGFKIGVTEIFSKIILYYLHERIWFKSAISDSSKRHFFKTFSWRFIGTLDTIILGWLFTSDISIGLTIGIFETLTKMILYFMHEKIWYKINFGVSKIRQNE